MPNPYPHLDIPEFRRALIETVAIDTEAGWNLHLRHLAQYRLAAPYLQARLVLEVGCNLGYGAAMLRPEIAGYFGLDLSEATISAAAGRGPSGPKFALGDAARLPFKDDSFEALIAFQLIEHLPDPARFLKETARVTKPGGTAVIITPNRKLRLWPGQRPLNPEHFREYDARGLAAAVGKEFRRFQIFGLDGPPELKEMERKRWVRNRRYWLARKIIPVRFRQWAKTLWPGHQGRKTPAAKPAADLTKPLPTRDRFSIADFRFDPERADSGLDLVAVIQVE